MSISATPSGPTATEVVWVTSLYPHLTEPPPGLGVRVAVTSTADVGRGSEATDSVSVIGSASTAGVAGWERVAGPVEPSAAGASPLTSATQRIVATIGRT